MANVSSRDLYLDADGKQTADPKNAVQQIAFKGAVLTAAARHVYGLNEDGSSVKEEAAQDDDAPAKAAKTASKKSADK